MTIQMTRKGFLSAAASGTVLLLLQACGGSDDDGNDDSISSCNADGAAISGNHGHALTIPAADLESASERQYNIQGGANHSHTITLTATQLAALKAGQSVTVTSSTDAFHAHDATISCA